jgi:hypothetical protein
MAITQPIATEAASGTIYATDGIETLTLDSPAQIGDMIIALAGCTSSNRTITVTDDRSGGSHTYTQAVTMQAAATTEDWIYYTVCDATVSNITFTLSSALASPGWCAVIVLRASNGWDATPVGDSDGTGGASAQASPTTGPSLDTTAASSVVVGVFQPDDAETITDPATDSDTNNLTTIINFSGGGHSAYAGYRILTTTKSGYNFRYAYSTGNATSTSMAVEFQETAAAGRTTKNTRSAPLGSDIGMGWQM